MDDQHKRGLLRLFVLRTLSSEPKSGYDILKEITEKTQGEWHPSKGTIYPILSELDKEGLIETVEEGARARGAFRTTDTGMSHLTDAIERHRPSHRGRMDGRRLLFVETFFDETEREILRLSHSIRRKALSTNRKRKAIKLLKEALRSIADLEESK
jgi:DNA-binding PadR family transcriptional regulator